MILPERLQLAHLPTPIQELPRLSSAFGRKIYLWRDDLTGFVESGNKVRKLEFLLAEARSRNASRIITAGGVQSNHTRTTTYLAARLGLPVTLVVRQSPAGPGHSNHETTGNSFLNRLAGANIHPVAYQDYRAAGSIYDPFLQEAAEASRRQGEQPYVIPEGGSSPLGTFGYLTAVKEMLNSWRSLDTGKPHPDALFLAVGSGGTLAGLHLGYAINDLAVNGLWAVNVCDSEAYFQKRVGKLIRETVQSFDLISPGHELQILDGHFGQGYGLAEDADLRFYIRLARHEGIVLDPTYTGKAFRGMLTELRRDPDRFGTHILFLHSGGTFGNFAYQEQYDRVLSNEVEWESPGEWEY